MGENLKNQFQSAREFMWTDKGLQTQSNEIENNVGEEGDDSSLYDEWSWGDLKFLLENCSCVVGMHPDQAAEGIVDFALRMKKPFALLPCCVYSKQFPKKKTSDGKHVTNY